jgi:hypothetical protein
MMRRNICYAALQEEPPVNKRDLLAPACAVATVGAVVLVPELPWRHPAEPVNGAVLGYVLTLVTLLWLRFTRAPARVERRVLAVFLGTMPLVYLASAVVRHAGAGALALEGAGLLLFAATAALGLGRRAWLLGAGIVAHGLGWDAWHHGFSYMPDWYALACLVADLGIGAFALLSLRRWRAAEVVST